MTRIEFNCSDEKATFLLKAANYFDEGVEFKPMREGRLRGVSYDNGKVINVRIIDTDDIVKIFEPVRHGRWEWCKDHWECSNCRGSRFHDLVLGLDAAYCGHCGAKMDLEENSYGFY